MPPRLGPIAKLRRYVETKLSTQGLGQAKRFVLRAMKDTFNGQGAPGRFWLRRATPNKVGALIDLAKGGFVQSKRFRQGKAGFDTGALYASLFANVMGDSLFFGSPLPYASKFAHGEDVLIVVTLAMKLGYAIDHAQSSRGRKANLAAALGKAMKDGQLATEVPARPFADLTAAELQAIARIFLYLTIAKLRSF